MNKSHYKHKESVCVKLTGETEALTLCKTRCEGIPRVKLYMHIKLYDIEYQLSSTNLLKVNK